MSERVFLNGELVAAEAARVPLDDRAVLFGESAFETVRAYRGKPFRMDRHLARLTESCRLLRLALPLEPDAIARGALAVLAANGLDAAEAARVRVTVTGGPSAEVKGLVRPGPAGLFITARPYAGPPAQWHDGITVVISGIKRNSSSPLSSLKSGNYLDSLLARQEALDRGADDAVMLTTAGNLSEATSSNLFMVKDGKVLTPNLGCGFLPGVTRETVIELCHALSLPLEAVMGGPELLMAADEVFLTNSMVELLPVARIVARRVGDRCPGPVTARLAEAYGRLVADELSL